MKFKQVIVCLSLPLLLASCGSPVKETSDYNANIDGATFQKMVQKIIYNASTIKSWTGSKVEVTDSTKTKNYGTLDKNTTKYDGYLASVNVLRENATKTKESSKAGISFTDPRKSVTYLFKNQNFYGKVEAEQEIDIINSIKNQQITPDYSNQGLVNYYFKDVFNLIDASGYEAWFDKDNKLNIVYVKENSSSKRIKHNENTDGFVGIQHSLTKTTFVLDGNDLYNKKIVSYKSSSITEINYDENENLLSNFVTTSSTEIEYQFSYSPASYDDVNENQLLNSFNKFNGNVVITNDHGGSTPFVNVSSQIITPAGANDLYHYTGLCYVSAGDTFSFRGNGTYSYVSRAVDIDDVVSYSLKTTSNFSKYLNVDSLLSSLKNYVAVIQDEGTGEISYKALFDITFELDLYLNINTVNEYDEDFALGSNLSLTVVDGKCTVLEVK